MIDLYELLKRMRVLDPDSNEPLDDEERHEFEDEQIRQMAYENLPVVRRLFV